MLNFNTGECLAQLITNPRETAWRELDVKPCIFFTKQKKPRQNSNKNEALWIRDSGGYNCLDSAVEVGNSILVLGKA